MKFSSLQLLLAIIRNGSRFRKTKRLSTFSLKEKERERKTIRIKWSYLIVIIYGMYKHANQRIHTVYSENEKKLLENKKRWKEEHKKKHSQTHQGKSRR